MSHEVQDASALIALIQREPGWQIVEASLTDGGVISAVNLAEVVTRQLERGLSEATIRAQLGTLPLEIVPFDENLAYRAGLLRPLTRHLGLSLGDRACLALAQKLGLPALTADRVWASLSLGITIQVIR